MALRSLEGTDRLVDARLWGEAMVPFVASLFVRGRDFRDQFGLRFAVLGAPDPTGRNDSVTAARLLQLQRFYSPVMRARWRLLRSDGSTPLVASDRGFAALTFDGRPGWVIPMGRTWALHLEPRPTTPRIFVGALGRWFVDVEITQIGHAVVHEINRAIAQQAHLEIYGDPETALLDYRAEMATTAHVRTDVWWGDVLVLRRNQFDLFRFLEAIATPPERRRPYKLSTALEATTYPSVVFQSINPDNRMSDAESAALGAIEDEAARDEYARLAEVLGSVGPLERASLPHTGWRSRVADAFRSAGHR